MKLNTLTTTFLLTAFSFAAPIAQQDAHSHLAELQSKPPCGLFKGEMWFPVRLRPDGSCPTSHELKSKDMASSVDSTAIDIDSSGASSYRPRRCGRYKGEMWAPMPRKPDGSCPSWRDDHPSKRSDESERRNLPPPCGRIIGEMWVPMERTADGTCPPGEDIRERDDVLRSEVDSQYDDEEWRDPMPGPVMLEHGSILAVSAEQEQEGDAVAEATDGEEALA